MENIKLTRIKKGQNMSYEYNGVRIWKHAAGRYSVDFMGVAYFSSLKSAIDFVNERILKII